VWKRHGDQRLARLPEDERTKIIAERGAHRATARMRHQASRRSRVAARPAMIPGRRQAASEVGRTADGGLVCPRCGGTQFEARRSNVKRAALVPIEIGTPLTSQNQVRCVTCGTKFKRG
jgi:DNA-directed RNA polymerase subunit RPC12/RpoP